jgi:hypothetical protein
MPRRTHPTTRNRTRTAPAPTEPSKNNYEAMARNLIERGLATTRILDRRQPMERRREW